MTKNKMFRNEYFWKWLILAGGLFMIAITVIIAAFLIFKGSETFIQFRHTIGEFLFSSSFSPNSAASGDSGTIGSAVFILGSFVTCGLALLISTPFSLGAAIFMTEIAPKFGSRILQSAIEIFVGIPSIVYGWTGLTILVPAVRDLFHLPYGNTIFTAALVLALMIFPSITSVSADAIRAIPKEYHDAAYGLGSTRWQMIKKVILPAARPGVMTGIILGLTRAFGEALAVAMVIGKTKSFPSGLFSSGSTLTSIIASNMGNTFDGTEYNSVLWSMALLLFIISFSLIIIIHIISARGAKKAYGKN